MMFDAALEPPSGPDCARYIEILPLLSSAGLPDAELAAAQAHVATCPHCQYELSRYAQLDVALRDRFTPPNGRRPLFTAEGIMRQTAITVLPRQRFWRIPVATIVVIAVALALVFVVLPARRSAPPRILCADPQPLTTLTVQPYVGLSVLLTTPDDGWVVGNAPSTISLAPANGFVGQSYLLHYQHGQWGQVPLPIATDANTIRIINALGPTDVWFDVGAKHPTNYLWHYKNDSWSILAEPQGISAVHVFASNDIFAMGANAISRSSADFWHYDGITWKDIATPPPGGYSAIQMLSPTDAWGIGGMNAIAHWDGVRWQNVAGPFLPEFLWSISFDASTDGWTGGGHTYYHYHNGTWQLVQVNLAGGQEVFDMLTPDDGWVGGTSLFAHYQHGVWQALTSPLSAKAVIYNFSFATEQDGWAAAADVAGSDGQIFHPRLMHYQGGVWQAYDMSTIHVCLGA